AAKKPDSHALTRRPALNTSADGIYPSDDFMARDARPVDGKGPLDRASVGVANATGLHPNPHLTGTGINQRFHYGLEFARLRDLNCFVCCAHMFIVDSVDGVLMRRVLSSLGTEQLGRRFRYMPPGSAYASPVRFSSSIFPCKSRGTAKPQAPPDVCHTSNRVRVHLSRASLSAVCWRLIPSLHMIRGVYR